MGILWSIITLLSVIGIFAGLTMLFVHRKNDQQKRQSKIIFFGSIIALFASGFIFSNIDQADANKTRINHNEITYQQLNREVSKLQDQKESLSTEISDLKDDHKDIIKAIDNKNELENQVSEKQDQLKTLSSKISSSKEELSKLAGQVTAAAGVPKTLSAGKYTVGKDVKAGRYKATPIGDGSNFIVYDGDDPIVNTVLGSDGEASYTFECDEGNIIQTESAVKLTPVK